MIEKIKDIVAYTILGSTFLFVIVVFLANIYIHTGWEGMAIVAGITSGVSSIFWAVGRLIQRHW